MGFDQPGNDAEIAIKIKPLTALGAATPPTPSSVTGDQTGTEPVPSSDPSAVGVGGATSSGGAGVPGIIPGPGLPATPITQDPTTTQNGQLPNSPSGFGPGGQTIVPESQRVTNANPTLVTHPLGARTDDIYEAAVAQLAHDTQAQYLQQLQDLGWMDANGQFIPGLLETEAVRNRSEIGRQRDLTLQNIMEGSVRGGTVFSGRRAQLQAQGQQPYDAALANLETVLGRETGKRYQNLGDLTRQFELSRNSLVADAAERYQNSLLGGPAGDGGGGGGGGGEAPASNADPYGTMALNELMAGWDPVALAEFAAAPFGAPMLSKSAWLAKNPGGNYLKYQAAWRRKHQLGGAVATSGAASGGGSAARVM